MISQEQHKRLAREKKTMAKMIAVYCKGNHRQRGKLCRDCERLFEYAAQRIDNCRFAAHKPVCSKCRVHCYKQELRQQIKKVMKFAGPKMIFYHPYLAARHFLDAFRSR